jgi:hypothetical protein
MTETPKQSDQLPEEGPAEQVPDDVPEAGEGAARESSRSAAGEEAGRTSERGGAEEPHLALVREADADEDAVR